MSRNDFSMLKDDSFPIEKRIHDIKYRLKIKEKNIFVNDSCQNRCMLTKVETKFYYSYFDQSFYSLLSFHLIFIVKYSK